MNWFLHDVLKLLVVRVQNRLVRGGTEFGDWNRRIFLGHGFNVGQWHWHEGERVPCLPLIKYSAETFEFHGNLNKSSSMEKRRRKGKPHLLTNLIVLWQSSKDGGVSDIVGVWRRSLDLVTCWGHCWTDLLRLSDSIASFTVAFQGYESNLELPNQLRRALHLLLLALWNTCKTDNFF